MNIQTTSYIFIDKSSNDRENTYDIINDVDSKQDLISNLLYWHDIYPLIFDRKILSKLTQISSSIFSKIIEKERARKIGSITDFLTFIETQDIVIPKEIKMIDYTSCKYFFDFEAVGIRKSVQISRFLYEQNDLCISSLKDAEKKIPQPEEFSRIIHNLKPLCLIEKIIENTDFFYTPHIDNILNFLLGNGLFEKAFALIKEKEISCVDIKEDEFNDERHNYTLINAPFLTRFEKFIIIRDIFNNSVFPRFKFSLINSKFKCYDARTFRPVGEGEKLMPNPKSDIASFFKLAMTQFSKEGDVAKCEILKAVILQKKLPNATNFEKAVVAWENEKKADRNTIAETISHLLGLFNWCNS